MKKLYILFTIIFISQISFAQPANDDCANADSITVSTTSINVPFDINTAVLNSETICSTTASFADVWYQFTMPFDGNVYVDGAIGWNNFALYDACGGIEIDCGNTSNLFTNLTSGNSYTLRVYRTSSTSSNTAYQDFDIKAFQGATNDDCVSAENITVSTSASTVNFEIGGASVINEVLIYPNPFSNRITLDSKLIRSRFTKTIKNLNVSVFTCDSSVLAKTSRFAVKLTTGLSK